MDDLIQHLEESFMYLGLSEDQEKSLLQTAQTAVDNALHLYEQGYEMDKELKKLIEQLERVMENKS